MNEVSNEKMFGEKTTESVEEISELTFGDESWSELLDSEVYLRHQWSEEMPLSEDLRRLDEEQKRQIAEARAWVEEEEEIDKNIRKDIADLQLSKQKNELNSSLISPEIPPEAEEKIFELEEKVKTLQDQLDEKTSKVTEISDSYQQILEKLNESRERTLATDREFKASFNKIKKDYAEVEGLLKSEIDRYKNTAKQVEFKLIEKEIELSDLRQDREELLKSKSDLETKFNESSTKLELLNKTVLKLKVQLKNIKTERDSLRKEKENAEDLQLLRDRITLLEEEKGNLQLQVIDLDEIKEAAITSQKKYADLESSFTELKNSSSLLENENQRILINYENAESKIKEQQTIIDRFLRSAQESEEQKIIAVMRSVELEEQLSFRDKEISQLKEDFQRVEIPGVIGQQNETESVDSVQYNNNDLLIKIKQLQDENHNSKESIDSLRSKLADVENILSNYKDEKFGLQSMIEQLSNEKAKLEQEFNEMKLREVNSNKGTGASTTSIPPNDPIYQKYKKVVANYKLKLKLCQELEAKVESINIELTNKDVYINKTSVEKEELEEKLIKSNNDIVELNKTIEDNKVKIRELISAVEQICCVEEGTLGVSADGIVLNDIIDRWKIANESNVNTVQQQVTQMNTVLINVGKLEAELEGLKKLLKDKDEIILELEDERIKLSDIVKFNEKELEMLRSMYEKVSEKNENFYSDLMSIEKEMANGKNELLSRLEVVTQNYDKCLSNLQERENYIETLEQDIVTMKTKMYNIESGMDERHRILKETSDQLMAKFQAAEIMSQTFEKYKTEVEQKIETLEEQKNRAEGNVLILKDLVKKLEEERDFIVRENGECITRLEEMLNVKGDLESKLINMSTELDNLRDIRNSYNTTLDKIEELNSELTQTTLSFELKNQRLESLEQERMELVNKLTDLEDAFTDLESKLDDCTLSNNNLQSEISLKNESLAKYENDRIEYVNKINSLENTSKDLERKLSEYKDKSCDVASELNIKNNQLLMIEQERKGFIDKLDSMENVCVDLGTKLEQFTSKNTNLESELNDKCKQLTETNQKLFDLQTQLVESEALCASLQDKVNKTENYLQQLNSLQDDNKRLMEVINNQQQTLQIENKNENSQTMNVFTWTDQSSSSGGVENPFSDIKDEESDWGWMAKEAALEHDHKHSEALKIQELSNTLAQTTQERDQFLNELNSTKTKCQKLMKKIKEIKTINENLERSKSHLNVGFSDLDFAVQEELRGENDKLQMKLNELNTQLVSVRNEKDSLTKKVDTLINANEQLVDLKERQDLEVQMWQKKSNRLMNEVKTLKLSSEDSDGSVDVKDKLTALINENNELKLILEAKNRELEVKTQEIDYELPEKFAALACENEELTALLNAQKYENETKYHDFMEKLNNLLAEKENLLKSLEMKELQIEKLQLQIGDPELPDRYRALTLEFDFIKQLMIEKELEIDKLNRIKHELEISKKNLIDFSQQTDNVEVLPLGQENIKLFSFDNHKEDAFSNEIQLSKEINELKSRVDNLTEERVNLENHITRIEEELFRARNAEEEAELRASKDKDDLSTHLEDVKREAALWRQKAEEAMKEGDAKEKMYYTIIKDKEQEHNQMITEKDEEKTRLMEYMSSKEELLLDMTNEVKKLKLECDDLKSKHSIQKAALKEDIKRLSEELPQRESEDDKDKMINDLQKQLDDTIKDNSRKDDIIDRMKEQIKTLSNLDSKPDDRNENIKKEKLIIETLLKERETEVENLRQELTTLMKRKAETQEHDDGVMSLKDKDSEIGRLTRTVVEMQERLLRMEEGKLLANINNLQERLDKALGTVYERDVKCEEFTQEILQLLEERDELQFRLSEALRKIDLISTSRDDFASSSSSPMHTSHHQLYSSPVHEKINKLRHEYKRDPTVQLESENRHAQHMELYSQESTETNREPDSSQSADYGIFNWFFGTSAPTSSSSSGVTTHPQSNIEET